MDDLRILWMRDRVYAALGLQDESLFRELLLRNESQAQKELLAYLDQPAQQLYSSAVLFYVREAMVEKEEEEIERKISMLMHRLLCRASKCITLATFNLHACFCRATD